MEIIINADKRLSAIMGSQNYLPSTKYRKIYYICEAVQDGVVLLYQTLTRQLISLSESEYQEPDDALIRFLVNHWYMIPETVDERSLCYSMMQAFYSRYEPQKSGNSGITGYTIFTTTDCNARCPYCYEIGRPRIAMSNEIALKTAEFIEKNRGNNRVNLSWFGGEPLYNSKVIGVICDYLAARDIPYTSTMISNGFLINQHSAEEILERWKLQRIQITLDGTREVYNNTKKYIYDDENPFERVLQNIEYLTNIKVRVSVRMNISSDNIENLKELVALLSKRFHGNQYFSAYSHPIFNDSGELEKSEYEVLCQACVDIQKMLTEYGISNGGGLHSVKSCHCMADSGKSVCVTPTGMLTLCEHHSDDEFVGSLDTGIIDQNVVDSWKERIEEKEECQTCFYYPMCVKLKKCVTGYECDYGMKVFWEQNTRNSMISSYRSWLQKRNAAEKEVLNTENSEQSNQAAVMAIISAARKEVGYAVDGNVSKYIVETFRGDRYKPWCMSMINWLFEQCFGAVKARQMLFQVSGFTNYCYMVLEKFQDARRTSGTPQVGDLVFFHINAWTDHVGLVTEIENEQIKVVSGNVRLENGQNGVVELWYSLNDEIIVAFGHPDWRVA